MSSSSSYKSKPINLIHFLILSIMTHCCYCQIYTNNSMIYDGQETVGLGSGVIIVICSLILGLLICIFGMSTAAPGVFIAIGFCIPLFFFLFFSFCPMQDLSGIDAAKNKNTNVFIVWRWLYFSVMLALVIAACVPIVILWAVAVIPQRVDSRAQKKHDEVYEDYLRQERKKKDNEAIREQFGEMPGGNGETNLNLNRDRTGDVNANPNANANLNNGEGYQQQPMRVEGNNELPMANRTQEDQRRFGGLKRNKPGNNTMTNQAQNS